LCRCSARTGSQVRKMRMQRSSWSSLRLRCGDRSVPKNLQVRRPSCGFRWTFATQVFKACIRLWGKMASCGRMASGLYGHFSPLVARIARRMAARSAMQMVMQSAMRVTPPVSGAVWNSRSSRPSRCPAPSTRRRESGAWFETIVLEESGAALRAGIGKGD
jgi:hypothetical protein